jgi:hypothetical protein
MNTNSPLLKLFIHLRETAFLQLCFYIVSWDEYEQPSPEAVHPPAGNSILLQLCLYSVHGMNMSSPLQKLSIHLQ